MLRLLSSLSRPLFIAAASAVVCSETKTNEPETDGFSWQERCAVVRAENQAQRAAQTHAERTSSAPGS